MILCVWSEGDGVDLGVRSCGLTLVCSWWVLEEISVPTSLLPVVVVWGPEEGRVEIVFAFGTAIQGRDDPHLCR